MRVEGRQITRGDVFRYMVMPEIKPRLYNLVSGGLEHVAFFMAMVYQMVRLLPVGHPYTQAVNIGRFGVRHVIAEAANHLTFSWRNLDQILLFFIMLAGMIIMIIQLCSIFFMIAFPAAMAAMPDSFSDYFVTPNPRLDIAFMFLDMVFGIPDFFGSCVGTGTSCVDLLGNEYNSEAIHISSFLGGLDPSSTVPFPIHKGLHAILQLYSYGLLIVAMMMVIYFLFVIVAETAQTGTAFGKRFNKVWAPLRIVIAFGLLIPFGSYGLNTSQYLVLYAAKFGSSFATNGWILFNDTLVDSYISDKSQLVGKTKVPELDTLLQFLFTARTCYEYYARTLGEGTSKYGAPKAYLVKNPFYSPNSLEVTNSTMYGDVLAFADTDAKVVLRFGYQDSSKYGMYKGFVKPLCGEIDFIIADPRDTSFNRGSTEMEQGYWTLIKSMYFTKFGGSPYYARQIARFYMGMDTGEAKPDYKAMSSFIDQAKSEGKEKLEKYLTKAIKRETNSDTWEERKKELEQRGWGGAAIWYNTIAEMNGRLTSSVLNIPVPVRYPDVMEKVAAKNRGHGSSVAPSERFNPQASTGGDPGSGGGDAGGDPEKAFWEAFSFWKSKGAKGSSHTKTTGNMILDVINAIFGTKGLFDMRENKDVHPLAQISSLGRGLIDAAVQNIGLAMIGGVSGVLLTAFDLNALGQLSAVFSSFMVSITTTIVSIGWLLFYVVPFLPFIYFFFAVSGWVKGIFEAMVGAPLWALAHIRIDGDGMMGKPAEVGYALIFEIFIRPILIVFGLLAGIMVFAAMVQMLNEIFELVTTNLGGFNGETDSPTEVDMEFFRGPLDQFMYTLIYAIIVYLMAMSSFKLVDQIPNQILRWLGRSDKAFNEEREDAGQGIMGTAFMGGQQTFGAIGGGLGKVAGGLSQAPRKQSDG